jgi:hypothetical protein
VSGATGSIVVTGVVVGVNTDGMTAGNILYLSASGQFTNVQPQAPKHIVTLGEVLRVQQNNGSIFVNISNGWELDELHDVRITNPQQGQTLVYSSSLWINSSSAATIETGSFITTGSSATTQNISGALNVSGNFTVVEQFPTINTNNTFFTSTGSTQLDLSIVRAGGGTTDVTNLRLQAISGSTTTDTVQSQLLVGNNNNTATFFSSSASINLSTVFATGSGGGRVAYSANVSVNSFSGSANVAITAPVVRMGQASANIISTGSWTHNGTFVTSNGITANQGGITATSGSINGELRVNGNSVVSASYSNRGIASVYYSTTDNVTGSYVNNFGQNNDTSVAGLLHVINISSASMATLIATSATNANTIYFVI